MNDQFSDFDWGALLRSLKNAGESTTNVLFIGPQLFTDSEGNLIDDAICAFIEKLDGQERLAARYYREEGLLSFQDYHSKWKLVNHLQDFYESIYSPMAGVLEKLAKMPFSIIVLLTHDDLLIRAYSNLGLPFVYDYYKNRSSDLENYPNPTSAKPLIFHMLGSLNHDKSVVFTHDDLFKYLESNFSKSNMPSKLKEKLSEANNYIFLGIPYEHWHMQLLLRVLNLHSRELNVWGRIAPHPIQNLTTIQRFKKGLFENHFGIKFFEFSPQIFISDLYEKCKEEGILKDTTHQNPSFPSNVSSEELKGLIRMAEIREAIDLFFNALSSLKMTAEKVELERDLTPLAARFAIIEKNQMLATDSDFDIKELNRIVYALNPLIDTYEKLSQ